MKKSTILLLLLVLLLINGSKAQEKGFESGIRAGINAAQVNGDDMAGFNKLGFVGGLLVNYNYSEKWKFGFEMLFSQKGSKRVLNQKTMTYSSGIWHSLRLNYIEVPVLATYSFNDHIKVQGGIGGAYLFSHKLEDPSGAYDNDDFRKYEINATLGAYYQFTDKWSLYARYTNSILPINKDYALGPYTRGFGGLTSLVASFGLYYHFGTGA